MIDKEAFEFARRFSAAGITRVARRAIACRARVGRTVPMCRVEDAQRAVRLVRAYAAAYGLDPSVSGTRIFRRRSCSAASLATRHGDKVYAAIDAADWVSMRVPLLPV